MRSRSFAAVGAAALTLSLVVVPAASAATPTVVASDLVEGASLNLVSHDNPFAGAWGSSGDGFEVYQRGVSPSIPFQLLDDTVSVFPPDTLGIIGEDETGRFFGATDTENPGNPDGPVSATWTFDVSGADGPLFLNVDAGAMGDFESSDTFGFAVSLDGGPATEVLDAVVDEAASRVYTLDSGKQVTLNDPIDMGGVGLHNNLQTVSAAIAGTGSQLTVRFTAQADGGSEAFAFDSLVITEDAPLGDGDGGDPEPSCDAEELTLISAVQGDGAVSPLAGSPVWTTGDDITVRGVVTLVAPSLGGMFVQEEPADDDGNALTSEGIFVATADVPAALVAGDTVEVTGGVRENFDRTQLEADEVAVCDVPSTSITPTGLTMPADTATRETLEGMVVETTQDLAVSSLYTAWAFGELGVALDGPLTQPTSAFAPDDPQAAALDAANAEAMLFINDRDEYGYDTSPWFDTPARAGDLVLAGTVGALNYSFGDFLLEPLGEFPAIVPVASRPEAPALAGGNDIGAFNVLNYFNDFDGRGAQSQAEFDLQSAKIVEAIVELDAAVLGLVELENDYHDEVPAVETLVAALNDRLGDEVYDWVRPGAEDLVAEGLGPDEIAVGIIYQPARATEVGDAATFDIDALLEGEDTDKNRWPLAQSFDIDGQVVTVVVNHFKSKGSSCEEVAGPDFDFGDDVGTDLTGNCNLTREYAAQRLMEWIETKPTGVTSPDAFVVGDLNSYEEEGPVEAFIEAGYRDAIQSLGDDAFTYKFDGVYGRLDHVLASPSAKRLLDDAAVWQANSAEPVSYLYDNDPIETVDTATAYASSDHDPVVISIGRPGRSKGGPHR